MNSPETREDRVGLVASLGLPAEAEAPRRYIEEGSPVSAAGLAALVDDEVAERMWRRWNPTQAKRIEAPPFRTALRELLGTGVGMGYALDRFRAACLGLPEFDPDGERWIEPFERAVAATNTMDLRVFVSPEVRVTFVASKSVPAKEGEQWDSMLSMMSDGLFYELGIVLPRIDLLSDSSLASTEFRIEINDARLPRCALLAAGRAMVNDTMDRLTLLNVAGDRAINPQNNSECSIINAADVAICEQAGLSTWTPMGYAVLSISAVVRRMAGAFANCYLVDFLLDQLAQAFPTSVREMRKAMSREALAQLLRALLDEEISIRNLIRILEVLTLPDAVIPTDLSRYIVFSPSVLDRMQWYREEPRFEQRLNRVRAGMKRFISHKYTRGANTLMVYLLDQELEARLEEPLPLSRQDHALLLRAVRDEIGTTRTTAQNPVILTHASIRRRLRRELAAAMPSLSVLSYHELSADMNIQPIARIKAPELTDPLLHLGPPQAAGPEI